MNTNCQNPVIEMDIAKSKKLWIHCNSCFVLYVNDTNIIFLLACQHVICDKCVTAHVGRTPNDAPTYTCPICGKVVRGRQVNNALPTNLKDMFHPEPWTDGLPHVLVGSFQQVNHRSMTEHIDRKAKEADKLEKDLVLALKICRRHYLEQHRMREERKQVELHMRKVHRQAQLKKEAQRRNLQQKSTHTKFSKVDENQPIKKRAVSDPMKAITSFIYNTDHSFLL